MLSWVLLLLQVFCTAFTQCYKVSQVFSAISVHIFQELVKRSSPFLLEKDMKQTAILKQICHQFIIYNISNGKDPIAKLLLKTIRNLQNYTISRPLKATVICSYIY